MDFVPTLSEFDSQLGGHNSASTVCGIARDSNFHAVLAGYSRLDVCRGGAPQKLWIHVSKLFPDDFYDDPLFPLSIELGVEDSLPRSQIQLALCDRQGHRLMQQQTLEVRVAIVLTGLMVAVGLAKRRELLQPLVDILNQARFVIVHIDGGGNVHR